MIDYSNGNSIYLYKSRFFSKAAFFSGEISEYIAVPSIYNPRWLILNDKETIKNHGAIIKPTSLKSRIVWKTAKLFNLFNLFSLIFPHRVVVADSSLASLYNGKNLNAAILYTGAPGNYQKFTIQFNDDNNRAIQFFKVANTVAGIKRIKNEEIALKQLSEISFKWIIIPNLLNVINKNEFYGFIQNNILSDESVFVQLSKVDIRAVHELHTRFVLKETSLHQYFNQIEFYICIESIPELKGYISRLDRGKKLILTCSHGDFIPWNRFISGKQIKLIDWETFKYRPLFYDLCYFLLHKVILIDNLNAKSVINESFCNINDLLCMINEESQIVGTNEIKFYMLINFVELFVHYKKNNNSADYRLLKALSDIILDLKNQQMRK